MGKVVYTAYPQVSYEEFLPEVLLHIPEVTEEIAMHYIRQSCIDVCRRAKILQREIELELYPCVSDYLLDSPDCVDVMQVVSLRSGVCAPRSYVVTDNVLTFTPAPTQADQVTVTLTVSPREDSCEVDAILFNKYKELVQSGALWRLYIIPRRPWSDQNAAALHRTMYDNMITSAGVDRVTRNQQGPYRVRSIFQRR